MPVYLYRGFLILGISFGIFFRLVKSEITFGRRGPGSIKKKRREGRGRTGRTGSPLTERRRVTISILFAPLFFSVHLRPVFTCNALIKVSPYDQFRFQSSFVSPVADWIRTIGNKNATKVSKGIFHARKSQRERIERQLLERVSFMRKFQHDATI